MTKLEIILKLFMEKKENSVFNKFRFGNKNANFFKFKRFIGKSWKLSYIICIFHL